MNDYPTDGDLDEISGWTGTWKALWEYVVARWHWPDWGVKEDFGADPYKLELHTGGWSGNESIMYALEHSRCQFYGQALATYKRGGHYWFEAYSMFWEGWDTLSPVHVTVEEVDNLRAELALLREDVAVWRALRDALVAAGRIDKEGQNENAAR